jgi:hypothetical protein
MELAKFVGAWRLRSAQFEIADTGERIDMYGPHPLGWLMVSESGRVSATLMAADRAADSPAQTLFETMMAYTASVRSPEPGQLVFTIDAAWQPSWIGSEQVRYCTVEDDVLRIRTNKQTHPILGDRPIYGVLEWERG